MCVCVCVFKYGLNVCAVCFFDFLLLHIVTFSLLFDHSVCCSFIIPGVYCVKHIVQYLHCALLWGIKTNVMLTGIEGWSADQNVTSRGTA